jgi:hypothetical protein
MKHAGPVALASIEPLLQKLRERTQLKERSPGVFYLKSRAFLHFHEDPAGLFVDYRPGSGFVRQVLACAADEELLLERVDRALGNPPPGSA